jgi:hypothetical protein
LCGGFSSYFSLRNFFRRPTVKSAGHMRYLLLAAPCGHTKHKSAFRPRHHNMRVLCCYYINIYANAPSGSKFNKLRRRKVVDLKRIYNARRERCCKIHRACKNNKLHSPRYRPRGYWCCCGSSQFPSRHCDIHSCNKSIVFQLIQKRSHIVQNKTYISALIHKFIREIL